MEGVRPVRSLLRALVALPWSGVESPPVLAALGVLRTLYEHQSTTLPPGCALSLGRVWQSEFAGADRDRAFAACEVASLLNLRRALRNGTVWIEHSLTFRSRERLFLPAERWQLRRRAHYRRLGLPTSPDAFLEPLLERAAAGVRAVAEAATDGRVTVDTALHLAPIVAEPEDPQLAKLRALLDRRIGEAQLPQLMLAVDAEVRYSWLMLGREPRSANELVMIYAASPLSY